MYGNNGENPNFHAKKFLWVKNSRMVAKNFPFFVCVFVFVAAFFFTLGDGDDKIQIYSIVWYITSIKFSMLCQICFICYSIYMYVCLLCVSATRQFKNYGSRIVQKMCIIFVKYGSIPFHSICYNEDDFHFFLFYSIPEYMYELLLIVANDQSFTVPFFFEISTSHPSCIHVIII